MSKRHSYRQQLKRHYVFGALIVSAICLTSIRAQEKTPSMRKDLLTDEHFAPGEVLSAGKNAAPIGPLKVKSYRLERVTLAKPIESAKPNGTRDRLVTAFRLKVTLDSPPTNDYFIWVDDFPWRAYPSGYERNSGENSISLMLITPTSPFADGSTLAISTFSRKFERTELPEKLVVPLDVQTTSVPDNERLRIKSIRNALIVVEKKPRRVVWITISSPFAFPVTDSAPTLEIWDKVFVGGTQGNEAIFMMGADEFAQLRDGAQVIFKGQVNVSVGRLNKSMLDR
jgi:hypothetical protein